MPMLLKADAGDSDSFGAEEIVTTRVRPAAAGVDAAKMSDADIQAMAAERVRSFREEG
jgi:hypothetical protein